MMPRFTHKQRRMRQIPTIARNAFMELVRQPVFLVLLTTSTLISVFLAMVPYFGFGYNDRPLEAFDRKLVENGALTVLFVSGLFGAVLCATTSLAEEIRSGTALAVLSKPVSRVQFILGKFLGLAGALTVLTYANGLGVLLASRNSFDAYGSADNFGSLVFFLCIGGGAAAAALLNYFLNKQFVPWAVLFVLLGMTLGFVGICCMDKEVVHYFWDPESDRHARFSEIWIFNNKKGYDIFTNEQYWGRGADPKSIFAEGVNWSLIPMAVLLLFALWILAAVALVCSTRLSWMPTLLICGGFFVLGLMSDYFFGRQAMGGAFLTAGDHLVWTPPKDFTGQKAVFTLEARGIRDMPRMPITVNLHVSTASGQVNELGERRLTLRRSEVDERGYFPPNTPVPVHFHEVKDAVAPELIRSILQQELSADLNATATQSAVLYKYNLELEVGLFEELKKGTRTPADVARALAKERDISDLLPGHLSFYVFPLTEGLSKRSGEGGRAQSAAAEVIHAGRWWAKILYVLVPNWQLFWLADAIGPGHSIPWSYVQTSLIYVLAYLGVGLLAAFYLFEERELDG